MAIPDQMRLIKVASVGRYVGPRAARVVVLGLYCPRETDDSSEELRPGADLFQKCALELPNAQSTGFRHRSHIGGNLATQHRLGSRLYGVKRAAGIDPRS
ncbi:MAG: hypothetical protein NVSMB29_00530 [Candidatus Dormibacteria bacterium]